jgi:hypothetical protein
VGPRAGLDVTEKGRISYSYWTLNFGHSDEERNLCFYQESNSGLLAPNVATRVNTELFWLLHNVFLSNSESMR